LCACAGVSISGYYVWKHGLPRRRQLDDMIILAHIRNQFVLSREACRSLGMHVELNEEVIVIGQPKPGLIEYSDRASQYARYNYRRILEAHKMLPSMRDKGNCCDNAMVETVFKTIKSELIWRTALQARNGAINAIGEYIDGFDKSMRRYSALEYKITDPAREDEPKIRDKTALLNKGKSSSIDAGASIAVRAIGLLAPRTDKDPDLA